MSVLSQFYRTPSGQNYEAVARSTGVTTSATQGVFGTFVQITASAAHSVIQITGVVEPTATLSKGIFLGFAIGGSGSEVVKVVFPFTSDQANVEISFTIDVDPTVFAKGQRISMATANQTDTTQPIVTVSVALIEIND